MTKVKVAISQHAPVYMDLVASLDKAAEIIKEAANEECQLLVFGETWLTGYPVWLDYAPSAALWDHAPTKQVFAAMHANSVVVDGTEVAFLKQQAKEHGLGICMGINERVTTGPGQGTLYNAIITIDQSGNLVNHHRKLMPTYTEKMLYGLGDGRGLQAVEVGGFRVGSLVCWEHWMPLTRQALHNDGEEIHIALWPKVHEMHQIASRQYAFEGRCFVLAAGQITRVNQLPEVLDLPADLKEQPEKMLLNGGSCIIGPDGHYLVEPLFDDETLVTATLDLEKIKEEQLTMDVSGHYYRPDVFEFKVKR